MGVLKLVKYFRAPALPIASKEYSEQGTNQLANILRLYFNQLDQLLGQIVSGIGTVSVGDYTSAGRLKVITPRTVFFNTFQYGVETDVWESSVTTGGTAVHEAATSSVKMGVTTALGSKVIRQTLNVQRYLPGRPATLNFSVRLQTPVAGIRRRFGLYNGTDGFYFEDNGGTYSCVLSSTSSGSLVVNSVPRTSWNGDKLDGTGVSGIIADPQDIQIISINYEWYGAGQVQFGFVIGGETILVHTFNTGNVSPYPWCRTPFLPIRLEVENLTGTAAPAYMWQGSNSVVSDGETAKLGIAQNMLSPLAGTTLTTANTFYPVLSVRLKSTQLEGVVLPTDFQAATLDNTSIFFRFTRNATLTGAVWTDMPDANSFTQYDVTATAISGGIDLFSGFASSNGGSSVNRLDPETVYQIGRSSLGTVSDTITLSIAAINANKKGVASLTWIEQR